MRRPALPLLLVCLAGLLALIALPAVYVRGEIVDERALADRVGAAATSAPVRAVAAQRIVDAAVDAGAEQLLITRPLAIAGIESLLDTPVVRQLARGAARDAHALLVEGREGTFVLDLGRGTALVLDGLRSVSPRAAEALPEGFDPEVLRIDSDDPALAGVRRLVAIGDWLAWVAPLGAIACAAGALLLSRDRRRTLVQLGGALAVASTLLLVLLAVARRAAVPGAEAAPDVAAAAGALWDALLGDLSLWAETALLAGLVVAVVAAARRDQQPQGTVSRLLSTVSRVRQAQTPRWRTVRAFALLAAAALIAWEPELALRLTAIGLAVYAISELAAVLDASSASWLRQRAEQRAAAERARAAAERAAAAGASGGARGAAAGPGGPGAGRGGGARGAGRSGGGGGGRLRGAFAAARQPRLAIPAAAVVLAVAIAAVLTGDKPQPPARAAVPATGCNGARAYCDLRLDQYTFAGTHNSYSAAQEPGWLIPNQRFGIARQLDDGIRAFLLDVHVGEQTDQLVRTDLRAEGMNRNKVTRAIGADNVALADRLIARAGAGTLRGRRELFLCHTLCELGAAPALAQMRAYARWLDRHPGEVLLFMLEPYVPPRQIVQLFRRAGLLDDVWTLDRQAPLPTLGDLVRADRRLLVFTEADGGAPPWYMKAWSFFQDTPLGATKASELRCRRQRGDADSPLLLVNHWIDAFPPSPRANREIGGAFLERRLDRCARERDMQPNVVAVDFHQTSGVVEAASALNEASVEAARRLEALD
ncbi:hypothetical protein [Conexibacter arvalis]|uniref:Uncharacterized protein n=1 Tax=Conexibacter arvalis TaxID=912552 RepID=A0A840I8S2_9ACTN|nr:hypothetical protein [Conexibacter arvalis]MBB4661266.1 hypothetical protein [Conexibacter arvalis]